MSSMSNLFADRVACVDDVDDVEAVSARLVCMLGGSAEISDETFSAADLLTAAGADPDDVWDWHRFGAWAVIPTNTEVRRDGSAVMGAGVAKAAAERFADLEMRYGRCLRDGRPFTAFTDLRLLLAPTKQRWRQPSTLEMVAEAAVRVRRWSDAHPAEGMIAVPAFGCGRGGLGWAVVEPVLRAQLSGPRFHVCSPGVR